MEFASASGSKINNSPEERRSKKPKYETTSELESESKIPGFDIDIKKKNVKKQQDSILEWSRRRCEAGPGDDDVIEVSRASFAFAIDDIFEQILGSVDKASLFSCRLVSHKWRSVSTKMLKREDICIRLSLSEDPTAVYPTFQSSYMQVTCKQPLSNFMSFINDTYTQGCSLTLDGFPGNALKISNCSLNNPELQRLLDAYGKHLRYLYISSQSPTASQCEWNFIKQVEHLLCFQAPNLQRLDSEGLQFKSATSAPASTSELPGKTPLASNAVVEIRKKNLKLRRLTVKPASRKVIDFIVAMCPRLNQIDVHPFDFPVLIQPTNLFHFVREFNFDCQFWDFRKLQLLEAAICMSREERQIQNLPQIKFTALKIDFKAVAKEINSLEDVRVSLVRIINKILETSWDTLEHIDFTRHTENTLRGLVWPRVLPKVVQLYSQPNGSCGLEIFPLDGTFKIQDTLPRLKDMILLVSHDNITNSNEVDFLMKRRLGPVPSVTNVRATVIYNCEGGWGMGQGHVLLCFFYSNLLLELFPNATVSNSRRLPVKNAFKIC